MDLKEKKHLQKHKESVIFPIPYEVMHKRAPEALKELQEMFCVKNKRGEYVGYNQKYVNMRTLAWMLVDKNVKNKVDRYYGMIVDHLKKQPEGKAFLEKIKNDVEKMMTDKKLKLFNGDDSPLDAFNCVMLPDINFISYVNKIKAEFDKVYVLLFGEHYASNARKAFQIEAERGASSPNAPQELVYMNFFFERPLLIDMYRKPDQQSKALFRESFGGGGWGGGRGTAYYAYASLPFQGNNENLWSYNIPSRPRQESILIKLKTIEMFYRSRGVLHAMLIREYRKDLQKQKAELVRFNRASRVLGVQIKSDAALYKNFMTKISYKGAEGMFQAFVADKKKDMLSDGNDQGFVDFLFNVPDVKEEKKE